MGELRPFFAELGENRLYPTSFFCESHFFESPNDELERSRVVEILLVGHADQTSGPARR